MEIKNCPCCGNEAIYGANESRYTIKCTYCGLNITDDRKDKVIGLWNQRYGLIEAYNEAIKLAAENVEIVVTEEYEDICKRKYSHKGKRHLKCSEDDYYYAVDKDSILKLKKSV